MGLVLVGQDQVPAVAAVLAAVRHEITGQPDAVLPRWGQEMATATAIDTNDGGFRLQHTPSLARMDTVTACE